METRWIATVTCASIVLLAGCAGEQAGEAETEEDTAAVDTMAAETGAPTGMAGGTFEMAPKNESGVTGQVRLASRGADTMSVRVQLEGVEAGTEYASHIHSGTCAQPGNVVVPLNSVPGGEGEAETAVALDRLPGQGPFLVMSHGSGGQPIACGELPQGWRGQMSPGAAGDTAPEDG